MIPRRSLNFYPGELGDAARFLWESEGAESVRAFEAQFAKYIGVRHAIATCTGRFGLELILRAMKLPAGSEVLLPAYTLGDLLGVLRSANVVPVAVDVDLRTFNMDAERVEQAITRRTSAILATHLFGAPCALDALCEIARRRGVRLIEDCAHAAGALYHQRKAGSFGDAAFFSFEVIKPLNTFGGGMVTTNDDDLALEIRAEVERLPLSPMTVGKKVLLALADEAFLRSPLFGPAVKLLADPRTRPVMSAIYWLLHRSTRPRRTRLAPFQAYLGLRQLPLLDHRNAAQRQRAARMTQLLQGAVFPQMILPDTVSTCYFYVALLPQNAELIRRKLLAFGVDVGVGSEITDNCAALLGQKDCPVAEEVFRRAIQIPIHARLTSSQIRQVAHAVRKAVTL